MSPEKGHLRLLHSHVWLLDASRVVGRDECHIGFPTSVLIETYVATRGVEIKPLFSLPA